MATAAIESATMTGAVDRALEIWKTPPPEGDSALDLFRTAYADPVIINDTPFTCTQLVERARATHRAFADLEMEVVDRIDAGDKAAVAFRQSGKHVGALPMPGAVEPSGDVVSGIGMDIFTIVDDRIARIWVVSELLSQLVRG